ncbi:MAG: YceD family protein [Deltaproteobacteria bacterium]
MKINLDRLAPEPSVIEEEIAAKDLGLEDVPEIELREPIDAKAVVTRITNAVHVKLELRGKFELTCSRCANAFVKDIDKKMDLDYAVEPGQHELDLDPEIREELILGIPIKNLCKPDCKGLCIRCGENLNEGRCKCKLADAG